MYRTCEELPVRVFFRIFETGDLSHLLEKPKKRLSKKEVDGLQSAWESIITEYEKLTHDNVYSHHMEVNNDRMRKINRLVGIKAAMMLLANDQEKGKQALAYWGIKVEDNSIEELKRVKTYFMAEQTKMSIRIESKEEPSEVNFYEHWTDLQSSLGYQLSHEKISVTEWVALLNTIKKRNGRKDK